MKFEDIEVAKYEMSEQETFEAGVMLQHLRSLPREQAKEEMQSIISSDNTGRLVVKGEILTQVFNAALEDQYGHLMSLEGDDPLDDAIARHLKAFQGKSMISNMSYTLVKFLYDCRIALENR